MLNKNITTLSLLASVGVVYAEEKIDQKDKHPNLVVIMADQWRTSALGFKGVEPVKTPHIDKMASEGVSFNQAVSSYPVSSPARGMFMTGMYPFDNNVISNCNSRTASYGVELDENAVCWSDILKDEGYHLGYIGKWHLDSPVSPYIKCSNNSEKMAWNEWCPPERRHGFDYWYAYGTYDTHLRPLYWDTDSKREEFFYVDQWGPEHETDKAIEFISKQKNKNPFALVVSMNPPHTGYSQVPNKYKEIYKDFDTDKFASSVPNVPPKGSKMGDHFRRNQANYYACITGVDENVGRIINYLKENNLYDNTIVVFLSDHGDCIGIHNEITKNNYYEESMGIPLIVTYPAKISPRQDNTTLIAIQDFYPTMLGLMGYKNQIPKEVQTYNLSKDCIKEGSGSPDFQPYYKIDYTNPKIGQRGLRTIQYTYSVKINEKGVEEVVLFDRISDPYQLKNIAKENLKVVQKLNKELISWLKKTDDPIYELLRENR